LETLLRRRIAAAGPITVAEYMAEALGHPRHGYYVRRDPFGEAGDFTTAPEVSQMFGELVGLWCRVTWEIMGYPAPFNLVELGPGRGTLMADALRAVGNSSGGAAFGAALRLHMVETSPVLRARQRRTLGAAHPDRRVRWHERFAAIPGGPLIVVANEFFDALPVHQYVRSGATWLERKVGVEDDRFAFVLEPAPDPSVPPDLERVADGSLVEACPAAEALAGAIAARIARFGGAALIIDYGHRRSAPGDTLQAVRGHAYAGVLDAPGDADLTHHVDFEALIRAATAAGAVPLGPIPQMVLLSRLGIAARAETLLAKATPPQAEAIRSAAHRLVHPREMGEIFKALALIHPAQPVPPGFDGEGVHYPRGTPAMGRQDERGNR
jgi:NADH dehydrogenase [ubiquinone] 1 alpha subcomplex assembly factor 7